MATRKQILFGIAIKMLNVAMGFLVVLLLARLLGPEGYGTYSIAFAVIMVATVPAALGLPNFVVREVAKAYTANESCLVSRVVQAALRLALMISSGILLGLFVWSISLGSHGVYRSTFWLGIFLIPTMAIVQILAAALRGIQHVNRGLILGLVLRPSLFLVLLFGFLLFVGDITAPRAMGLHLAGGLLALCFAASSWLRLSPSSGKPNSNPINARAMLMSTGVMGMITGASTLNNNLDVMMLGALQDEEAAGLYRLASTAAMMSVAGLQAINMVMMPQFARIHEEGNRAALQKLATQSVRYILASSIPVSLFFLLFGKQFLAIGFGREYEDSYLPLIILVVGQMVSALFGSVITILNMTGHEKDTLKGVLLGSLVNALLNLVLIPKYGAIGAAIATASTLVCWNVYLHVLIRKRLSINSTPFPFLNKMS